MDRRHITNLFDTSPVFVEISEGGWSWDDARSRCWVYIVRPDDGRRRFLASQTGELSSMVMEDWKHRPQNLG